MRLSQDLFGRVKFLWPFFRFLPCESNARDHLREPPQGWAIRSILGPLFPKLFKASAPQFIRGHDNMKLDVGLEG
jgi:hypothetical protein